MKVLLILALSILPLGAAGHYFQPEHRQVILQHYTPRPLPPGLQKKLARTGTLPPGWQKRMQPMPVAAERQLPPVCGTCRRAIVDNCAVVYDQRSHVILDLMVLVR